MRFAGWHHALHPTSWRFHWQAACLAAMASSKMPDWIILKSMTLFRNLGISKCNDGVTKSPDPNQNARPSKL